jgi:hypothetical protein
MAAYPSAEAAAKDFDSLVALIGEKKVRTEGVILVERDADGEVHVSQTGDHLGRKGLGWGGRPARGRFQEVAPSARLD